MSSPWGEMRRWLARARPPGRSLALALAAGVFATLTGLGLFIGAPYLLYFSVTHSHLSSGSTLAILLIVIELLAFLRSPSRYVERLSAHDLGLRSVTQWRRWLTATVGTWPYRRWVRAASGDLLDRALADTDALQDLWLRGVVPVASAVGAFVVVDVVIAALSGPTGAAALTLVGSQLVVVVVVAASLGRQSRRELAVRHARASRTAVRVELQAVAPELHLLGADAIIERRLSSVNRLVEATEVERARTQLWVSACVIAATIAALPLVYWAGSVGSLGIGEQIVVMLLALAGADLALVSRTSANSIAAVTAASTRLDALEHTTPYGHHPFPSDTVIDVAPVGYSLEESAVLHDIAMVVAPGLRLAITGANGSGKSTLLRLLARLDELPDDSIQIGGRDINEIDEIALRAELAYVPAAPRLLTGVVGAVMTMGRGGADKVEEELSGLGIPASSADRWTMLSRGETQRAALARALLTSPRVIILDEPTSGLGPTERALVLRRLESADATVIVATHDAQLIEWCDAVAELSEGRLSFVAR